MRGKRIAGILCAALLLWALVPAARAAEEPSEEPLGSEEPALAESEASPSPPPEAPAEEPALPDDPETPLYDEWLAPRLDAASGQSFSQFIPRALQNETLHRGIDVSAWQHEIDWSRVAASGVEFVIIRAAFRYTSQAGILARDAYFDQYIRGAKAAGLKVGAYIFSQAITVEEGVAEADYIASVVSGYALDLPLVIDFEFYPGGRLESARLSKRAGTDICNAFCARVEQHGYDSMVYANPDMLNNYLYPAELGRLWLAHYTTRTSYSGHPYEYWQCGSGGDIDGISGSVDLDFWFEPVSQTVRGPFSDVKEGDWYYDAVMTAHAAGIVNGVTETEFRPGGTATRGQVVTMLHRMAGTPAWTAAAAFADLTQDYYRDAIYWAAESGVVEGYSQTEFRPGRAITRQELVTLLYRLAERDGASGADLGAYADAAAVQSWAAEAMCWAIGAGLVNGYEDGTLRPGANATRAEVCTILTRYALL